MNLDMAIQSLDTGFTSKSFMVLSVYSRPKIQQVVKANPITKSAEKFFKTSVKYDPQLAPVALKYLKREMPGKKVNAATTTQKTLDLYTLRISQ